jgi:hypothetical protein
MKKVRVMIGLLQLAKIMGTPLADGSSRIAGLTHQTIAEYVGTSRELVTRELIYPRKRCRKFGRQCSFTCMASEEAEDAREELPARVGAVWDSAAR